jgi:two-component system, OmpR family, KDP operon response regulator KdpE
MAIHEATVLLIEDEAEIRRFLRTSLSTHGYRLYEAITGADGLAQAKARNPDIILLDLGLPDVDGAEVIRQVREWSTIPILVLSAREQEQAKVAALDLGADDYVTKPVFTLGDLKVDLGRRQVFVSAKEIHLTPIEYKLLTTLIRYAGRVMTHRQLLKEVWGPLHVEEGHYLRVYMRQLRNKLEKNPAHPRYLVTELGVGYRLRTE